jgi:hypothetical protein
MGVLPWLCAVRLASEKLPKDDPMMSLLEAAFEPVETTNPCPRRMPLKAKSETEMLEARNVKTQSRQETLQRLGW